MFEQNEEIAVAVDAIYGIATGLKRGEILTHESIRATLGLAPHEGRWDHIVNKARRRLERTKGISTWPEHTVGYKLCTPAEQVELGELRTRKAFRQIRRGRRSVEALPEKALSVHLRRSKAFMAEKLRDTEKGLRRDLKLQKAQLAPTSTTPRRPLIPATVPA